MKRFIFPLERVRAWRREQAALEELKLSPHNVVGVGDAENDQAFLSMCGCSVAVANAISAVKERADVCTSAARGAGVAEFISGWLP